MALSFKFASNAAEWKKDLREKQKPVAEASVAALRDVAATSVQEGRKDIAAAGQGFTHAQWLSGLQYRTKGAREGGQASLDTTATVYHKYGIAGVFEYGATIKGRPLMWICRAQGRNGIQVRCFVAAKTRRPNQKPLSGIGHHRRHACFVRQARQELRPQAGIHRRAANQHTEKVSYHRNRGKEF